jgi:uncharacterized SAM-binding protein YcdF (DUF218 family)
VTLLIILLLIVIALSCSLLRWRKTAAVILVLTAVLFVSIGCGPIPALFLTDLQSGYSANAVIHEARHTAIILLGNGTEQTTGAAGVAIEPGPLAYGRIAKALEVYRACKQKNTGCTIVITGGDPLHHGAAEATVYGSLLQRLGVDPADLLLESRSLNTWQNAQYTAALLESHAADQVILVTSGYHLRRSVLYFGHFGIHGQPVRADWVSAQASVIPLSYNFLLTDMAIHEYVGVWRNYLYEALGWNVSAAKGGSV